MSSLYPNSLDAFTNPTVNSNLNSPGVEHNLQHSDANDAIEALERRVGATDSADVTSVDYQLKQLQSKVSFTGAPVTATSTGTAGTLIVEGGYLYACIATNSWVRTAVAAW